jgi:predicted small lipoprotein YifL
VLDYFAFNFRSTMRCAAGFFIVLLAVSACGTKGALYLPPTEQTPQQDNKPAPRQ